MKRENIKLEQRVITARRFNGVPGWIENLEHLLAKEGEIINIGTNWALVLYNGEMWEWSFDPLDLVSEIIPEKVYTKSEVIEILESLKLYDGGEMQSMGESIHNGIFNSHIDKKIEELK